MQDEELLEGKTYPLNFNFWPVVGAGKDIMAA